MTITAGRDQAQRLAPPEVSARARPHGRLPFAFGERFFVLLLVGLVWVGPAFWRVSMLYGMLAWDLLLLAVWWMDLRALPRPEQLEVTRRWNAPAALSVAGRMEIVLRNSGQGTIRAAIMDDVPVALRSEPALVVIAAAGEGEGSAAYEFTPLERGDVRLGAAYLRYQSPFRVAQRWAQADLGQRVRIYPNIEEARRHAIYLVRARQIEMEKRLTRHRGLGREFESLREYRAGDERRDICWTATARRAKLVTRVYQAERSQTVWLVVDAGRLLRAQVAGLTKLDYAVNAALTLAQVALYSGDRVALLGYGRKPQQLLPPGRGPVQMRHLLEQLALVRGETAEADHLRAAETLMREQKRRSLVVWFTDLAETAMTPEVVESAMRLMPRHLVLFLVMGEPELRRLATQLPENPDAMYESTAAQEVIHRRELLLSSLRQRGALALEIAPAGLSTLVVNQYLRIKEKNQL